MMQKYAMLDERDRAVFAEFSSKAEAAEQGYLPYEESEKPTTQEGIIPHNYSRKYVKKGGKILLTWEAYPNYEEIERLEKKLSDSDYKVIKCFEASLVGLEMPYDTEELHQTRQEIRDEINRLEACE